MNHETTKLVLPLGSTEMASRAVPLAALYVLGPPDEEPPSGAADIVPLRGEAAFLEIIRASFNLLVVKPQRLGCQFAFGTRLAATVPIRRLTYRRRLSDLPRVCDAVLEDLTRV